MKSIAVIGSGGLGMRHVEALGRLRIPAMIYAVDPRREASQKASDLYDHARIGNDVREPLIQLSSSAGLPAGIDLAIVATTSQVRMRAIQELSKATRAGALVLEKFLFVRDDEYEAADKLLGSRLDSVWVNCSRRMYPGYQRLATQLKGARFVDVRVFTGASVAPLGTIGIHFLDLLDLLSPVEPGSLKLTVEDASLVPTRRGPMDFAGVLAAEDTTKKFTMRYTALKDSDAKPYITIDSDRGHFVIQEWCERFWESSLGGTGQLAEANFPVPFQSQLSHLFAASILEGRGCELTPYHTSAKLHRAMLAQLLAAFRQITGQADASEVPFT